MCKYIFASIFSFIIGGVLFSQNIYVNGNVPITPLGDGSIANPFRTISEGVDYVNSNPSDTLFIAAHNYLNTNNGSTNQDLQLTTSDIVIFGDDAQTTIIQLGNTVASEYFMLVSGNNVTLKNIQIIGKGLESYRGAVHFQSHSSTDSTYVFVENCLFTQNDNAIGTGGIGNGGGALQVGNSSGKGVVLTINNTQMISNGVSGAGIGGTIYIGSNNHLNLYNSRLACSLTSGLTTVEGGILGLVGASANIYNSEILGGNCGLYGGGIYATSSSSSKEIIIFNSIIANNFSSTTRGGGIFIEENIYMRLTNVIFSNNTINGGFGQGGAAFAIDQSNGSSSADFINCTFYGNIDNGSGYGSINNEDGSNSNVMNCIFYNNTQNGTSVANGTYGSVTDLGGNLFNNPGFKDVVANNFTLLPSSVAIDNGVLSSGGFVAPLIDLNDFSRSGNPDIGAFEFNTPDFLIDYDCQYVFPPGCVNTAPVGSSAQSFCSNDNPTIADLVVNGGANLVWYESESSIIPLVGNTPLVNLSTYYVSDETLPCSASSRFEVVALISNPTSPIVTESTQEFCVNGTVADLTPNAYWYVSDGAGNKIGNVLLPTEVLINGGIYVAVDSVLACESNVSSEVTVLISNPSTPSVTELNQEFCVNGTVADLTPVAYWYVSDGLGNKMGSVLLPSDLLVDGGTYVAVDSSGNCESTVSSEVTVLISNPSTPLVTQLNQEFCVSGSVADLIPAAYWYVSDGLGNKIGNVLLASDLLVDGGTYVAVDSSGNCESTVSSEVTVLISNPSTPLITELNQEFCVSGSVADLIPTAYWYVSDGLGNKIGNVLLPSDLLVDGGTYVAVDSSGNCESTVSSEVTVLISNPSTPLVTELTQVFCVSGSVADLIPTAYWYVSDGFGNKIGNVLLASDLLVDGGTYVAVDSSGNCESAVSSEVTVLIIALPNANFSVVNSDGSIGVPCSNQPINASVDNYDPINFKYLWSNGDTTETILNITDDIITLQVTSIIGGCINSSSSSSRKSPEDLNIIGNDFCENTSSLVEVDLINGQSLSDFENKIWYDKDNNIIDATNQSEIIISNSTLGVYLVAVDKNGCSVTSTQQLDIIEIEKPSVTINYYLTNGKEYEGYTIEAITSVDSSYWVISSLGIDSIFNELILYNQFPLDSTTYSFYGFNIGRGVVCESDVETIENLIIYPNYQIPNVVTPNGDGVNDYFYIANSNFIKAINIKVFNRWGNVLFETESKLQKDGWNGLDKKGNEVAEGAYFYAIEITEFNGTKNNYNGTVQLIR